MAAPYIRLPQAAQSLAASHYHNRIVGRNANRAVYNPSADLKVFTPTGEPEAPSYVVAFDSSHVRIIANSRANSLH